MKPPQHLIGRSFDQAAATYDRAAEVQRQACRQLAACLTAPVRGLILDAGCGTGYGLRLLRERFPAAQGIGLDLSPAMLARARPLTAVVGNAERLPFAGGCIDFYWSSLAAQWCALDRLLAEAVRVLRAGGRLALSTLGPATFHELRAAFAASDGYAHTLSFLPPETIAAETQRAGLAEIRIEHRPLVTHHPDFRSLLASIKAIGANQVGAGRRHGLMSRAVWQSAEAAYECQRQPAGLPLTYDLIYLLAAKPGRNR